MSAVGPKWFHAEADQPPDPVNVPLVRKTEPAGELLKPPKTMCPRGQEGVVVVAYCPAATVVVPDTSVRSGFLLRRPGQVATTVFVWPGATKVVVWGGVTCFCLRAHAA